MQVHQHFINWLSNLVITSKFSINLNGTLVGYIGSDRGLRQGDLSSSYPFLIVMEDSLYFLLMSNPKAMVSIPSVLRLKLVTSPLLMICLFWHLLHLLSGLLLRVFWRNLYGYLGWIRAWADDWTWKFTWYAYWRLFSSFFWGQYLGVPLIYFKTECAWLSATSG